MTPAAELDASVDSIAGTELEPAAAADNDKPELAPEADTLSPAAEEDIAGTELEPAAAEDNDAELEPIGAEEDAELAADDNAASELELEAEPEDIEAETLFSAFR